MLSLTSYFCHSAISLLCILLHLPLMWLCLWSPQPLFLISLSPSKPACLPYTTAVRLPVFRLSTMTLISTTSPSHASSACLPLLSQVISPAALSYCNCVALLVYAFVSSHLPTWEATFLEPLLGLLHTIFLAWHLVDISKYSGLERISSRGEGKQIKIALLC